jgi:hypothetical protein
MASAGDDTDRVRVPVLFVGVDDTPILYGNQFVIQHQQNEFILTVGQIAPPMLLGTEEQQREQAKQLDYVAVKVVARLAFTRARLQELIDLLQTNMANYDRKQEAGD